MDRRPAAPRERLAASLRDLRDRSGCTLRELERLTFTSDSALSRYFTAKAVPPWRVMEALCHVAGADPEVYRVVWARARATSRDGRKGQDTAPEHSEPLHVARRLHATLTDVITRIADRAERAALEVSCGHATTLQALRDIQSASRDAQRYLRAAEAALRPQQGGE
ncbi:helix-turn-helix domain-containing protein [Dactylosporangium sp. NPDC048998]|uniref:helix-turn-helix domain-containing protein n=1 Tax=Dactylosporangium sp. NPDC048998 TaxID=3363976 RepID=UPI003724254B